MDQNPPGIPQPPKRLSPRERTAKEDAVVTVEYIDESCLTEAIINRLKTIPQFQDIRIIRQGMDDLFGSFWFDALIDQGSTNEKKVTNAYIYVDTTGKFQLGPHFSLSASRGEADLRKFFIEAMQRVNEEIIAVVTKKIGRTPVRVMIEGEKIKAIFEEEAKQTSAVPAEPDIPIPPMPPTPSAPAEEQAPVGPQAEAAGDFSPALKNFFSEQGINLDRLDSKKFQELISIFNLVASLKYPEEINQEEVQKLRTKLDDLIEQKGVEENMRLPQTEYRELTQRFNDTGLRWQGWGMYNNIADLKRARSTIEEYERKFPGNDEIESMLTRIDARIAELSKAEAAPAEPVVPAEQVPPSPAGQAVIAEPALAEEAIRIDPVERAVEKKKEALARLKQVIEREAQNVAEIEAELKRLYEEEELEAQNPLSILALTREIENLNAELEKAKEESRESIRASIRAVEGIIADRGKNPYKYYCIDRISDRVFQTIYGLPKDKADLRALNRFGETGRDLRFWEFNENIPLETPSNIFVTSNGFLLEVQNPQEITEKKEGKYIIDTFGPQAKYRLIAPSGDYISEEIVGYDNASKIMIEKAEEEHERMMGEFDDIMKD